MQPDFVVVNKENGILWYHLYPFQERTMTLLGELQIQCKNVSKTKMPHKTFSWHSAYGDVIRANPNTWTYAVRLL